FQINGQRITALNGGPIYKLSPAMSFVIGCEDQAEVDHFWDGLTADGGVEIQCGWLTDRFGLSWQVVPNRLMELISQSDGATAGRVMSAMMQMKTIDIA